MIISAANGNSPLIQGWPYISVLQVFTSHGKYPLREDQSLGQPRRQSTCSSSGDTGLCMREHRFRDIQHMNKLIRVHFISQLSFPLAPNSIFFQYKTNIGPNVVYFGRVNSRYELWVLEVNKLVTTASPRKLACQLPMELGYQLLIPSSNIV